MSRSPPARPIAIEPLAVAGHVFTKDRFGSDLPVGIGSEIRRSRRRGTAQMNGAILEALEFPLLAHSRRVPEVARLSPGADFRTAGWVEKLR